MNQDIDFNIMRQPGFYNLVLKERQTDLSKIKKSGGWNHIHSCPVCSSKIENSEHHTSTEYGSYLRCKRCKCIYLNRHPSKLNSGQYTLKNLKSISKIPEETKRQYRMERFGEERVRVIDDHSDKPLSKQSLLDIGCNTGFFLETAKSYFNKISGAEIDPVLAEFTSKKLNCKVYTNLKSIHEKFDVITMFDTIEHVEKPTPFLQQCKTLLKPNGILLIFTPNYESLGFRWLGSICNQISPGHLSLFSSDTVSYIKRKLKMKLLLYETRGMDFHDILSYCRDIENQDIQKHIPFVDLIQTLYNKVGGANSMRFILKKVK